jgi:hypothetical protein
MSTPDYSVKNPYYGLMQSAADQYSLDADLLDATGFVESRFNPDAISPAGALGVMQLMPVTAQTLGVADRKNPQQNILGAAALMREELDRFGDRDIALAAYNAGSPKIRKGLRATGATSFEELEPWLRANGLSETADYVPKVLTAYNARKAQKPKANAPSEIEKQEQQGYLKNARGAVDKDVLQVGSTQEFVDSLTDIVNTDTFTNLGTDLKLQKLNQLYNSKIWEEGASSVLKDAAQVIWEESNTAPDIPSLVGPLPFAENREDISKNLATTKSQLVKQLSEEGVNYEIFDNNFDEYFSALEKEQLERYDTRERGVVGGALEATKELARGAVQAFTSTAAGATLFLTEGPLTREAGQVTAEFLNDIPDYLFGDTARSIAYETTPDGRIAYDRFGNPRTKLDSAIVQGFGQLGAMYLAGGALTKAGLGADAPGAAATALFGGMNVLSNANEAYQYTKELGGDHKQGLLSAYLSIPTSVLETAADTYTLGFAKPYVKSLRLPLNKARAMALGTYQATPEVVQKGVDILGRAVAGSLVEGGAEAVTETRNQLAANYLVRGEIGVLDPESISDSFKVGAIVGGTVAGAIEAQAPGTRFPRQVTQQPPTQTPTTQPVTQQPPTQTPATQPVTQQPPTQAPVTETPQSFDAFDQALFPGRYGNPSAEETVALAIKFEEFQLSPRFEQVFAVDNLANVPLDLLDLMGIDAEVTPTGEVVARKRTTYVPIEIVNDMRAVSQGIEKLQEELANTLSPWDAQPLVEERERLRKQLVENVSKKDIPDLIPLAQERRDLVIRVTRLKRQAKNARNTPEGRNTQRALNYARQDLQNFDDTISDRLPKRIEYSGKPITPVELSYLKNLGRLLTINEQFAELAKPEYVNDLQAKQNNLKQLLQKRKDLEATSVYVEELPDSIGTAIRIDGDDGQRNYIVSDPLGWFVAAADGTPLTKPVQYFSEAVASFDQAVANIKQPETEAPTGKIISKDSDSPAKKTAPKKKKRGRPKKKKLVKQESGYYGPDISVDEEVFSTVSEAAQERALDAVIKEGDRKYFARISREPQGQVDIQRVRTSTPRGNVPRTFVQEPPVQEERQERNVRPVEIFDAASIAIKKLRDTFVLKGGGYTKPNVRGYFHPVRDFAQVNNPADIPTVIHELGHAIDAVTVDTLTRDPFSPEAIQTLGGEDVVKALQETARLYYPANVSPRIQVSEGITMFLQHYVTRQPVHNKVLQWWNTRFASEYPDVHKTVEDLKTLTDQYVAQPATQVTEGGISGKNLSRNPVIRAALAVKESLYDNFQVNWLDSFKEIKKLDAAAENTRAAERERLLRQYGEGNVPSRDEVMNTDTYSLIRSVQGNARFVVKNNVYGEEFSDLEGNTVPGQMTLTQAVSPMRGNLKDLGSYMWAFRALNYAAQGIQAGLSVQDASKTIKDLEDLHGEAIKLAARNVWDWTLAIQNVAAKRLPSFAVRLAQQIQVNRAVSNAMFGGTRAPVNHGYFFPVVRADKGGDVGIGKDRTGSWRDIENPLKNLDRWAENLLYATDKRFVIEQAARLADPDVPAPVGAFIFKLDGDRVKTVNNALKAAVAAYEKQLSVDANEEIKLTEQERREVGDILALLDPNKALGEAANGYTLYAMVNKDGERDYYEIKDELLAAFDPNLPDFTKNPIWQLGAVLPRNLVRAGAVGMSPFFAVKNLLFYDYLTMFRNIQNWNEPVVPALMMMQSFAAIGMTKIPGLRNVKTNIFNLANVQDMYRLAKRMGVFSSTRIGADGGYYELQRAGEDVKIPILDKAINAVGQSLAWWEDLISTSEEATRVTAMRYRAKELGITDPNQPLTTMQSIEMALTAKRGTVDYGVQGRQARIVNQALPFFTARIAAVRQLSEDVQRTPGKHAVIGGAALAFGAYYALMIEEDENLQELEPELLLNQIILPVGDKAVRIPLDTFFALPYSMGLSVMSTILRDGKLAPSVREWASAFAKNNLPIDMVDNLGLNVQNLPPLLKTPLELATNEASYSKRPIVPGGLQFKPPEEQYTRHTTALAKRVGQMTGYSPLKIEHLIRSAFPVGMGAIRSAERVVGTKESKKRVPRNALEEVFYYYQIPDDFDDRSSKVFYEAWSRLRLKKDDETPQERKQRLAMGKIVDGLSDIRVILQSTNEDPELRKRLFEEKKRLLNKGVLLAEDINAEVVRTVPGFAKMADRLREQEKKTKSKGE